MYDRLAVCFAVLCALLFLACYLGTGSDERNMRSFWSYPAAVREAALDDERLAGMVPPRSSSVLSFVLNFLVFGVMLLICGIVARPAGLWETFWALLIVGEGLNLFDLLAIDLVWWRDSPRVRFSGITNPALYRDLRPHVMSFLRGIPMFALAALAASLVLTLFA